MSDINSGSSKNQNGLTITRIFDAPKELVWKAWTDPEHIKQWWGPKDYNSPSCSADFRIGGKMHFCMKSKIDGMEIWSTGVYKEIIPFEKIVMTDCFADEKGNVVPSTYYKMEGIPLEMLITVTFENYEGKTKMTLVHSGLPEDHSKDANIGWNESLDKLEASLK
ncbi:MAG: SRPBCC domain-containing protein [Bacteroidetes bacterium]|nr:SRPBCC domain-containing protein [Bacteroidota bacterium]